MSLRSMTGFARADGAHGISSWAWEVRSVNGRGLDVRLRLPPGTEALEPKVREVAGKRVSRGSVSINLSIARQSSDLVIKLNERALAQVVAAADRMREALGSEPVRVDTLINVRGVLEFVEPEESEEEAARRHAAMIASLETALDGLVAARAEEGGRLEAIFTEQIDAIERLTAAIAASPARRPEAIQQRLKEQIARILDTGVGLDPARLHQEAVLVATRADVEEEVKRLASHVAQARALIAAKEPVGRKLDFLAQELYREANTLCSKSNDGEMTRQGLELKAVIDQLREQVQNIE